MADAPAILFVGNKTIQEWGWPPMAVNYYKTEMWQLIITIAEMRGHTDIWTDRETETHTHSMVIA
jgi:hypothetical protein